MYGLPVAAKASIAAAAKSRSNVAEDASPGLAVWTMASKDGRISRSHCASVMSPIKGVALSAHTRAPAASLRTSAVTFSSLSTSLLRIALPACPVAPVRKTCISCSSLRKAGVGAGAHAGQTASGGDDADLVGDADDAEQRGHVVKRGV